MEPESDTTYYQNSLPDDSIHYRREAGVQSAFGVTEHYATVPKLAPLAAVPEIPLQAPLAAPTSSPPYAETPETPCPIYNPTDKASPSFTANASPALIVGSLLAAVETLAESRYEIIDDWVWRVQTHVYGQLQQFNVALFQHKDDATKYQIEFRYQWGDKGDFSNLYENIESHCAANGILSDYDPLFTDDEDEPYPFSMAVATEYLDELIREVKQEQHDSTRYLYMKMIAQACTNHCNIPSLKECAALPGLVLKMLMTDDDVAILLSALYMIDQLMKMPSLWNSTAFSNLRDSTEAVVERESQEDSVLGRLAKKILDRLHQTLY